MTTSAANLGAAKQRVTLQKNFVDALMDAVDRGISTLVDADMTEESTKLQALQVQQQLGTQSLSHRQPAEPVDPLAVPLRTSEVTKA